MANGISDLRIVDGALHIDGYPDASHLGLLQSHLARRLSDLRMHEAALILSEAGIQEYGRLPEENVTARQIMITGVVGKFFSCFGKNNASVSLHPSRVFKGLPQEALIAYNYWKALRDKHLIHSESEMCFIATGVVLKADGEIEDIISVQIDAASALDKLNCQNLYELIIHTLKFVRAEISEILPHLFAETRSLPPASRLKLPSIVYNKPDIDGVFRSRKKRP